MKPFVHLDFERTTCSTVPHLLLSESVYNKTPAAKTNPLSEVKKTSVLLITPVFSRVARRLPIVLSNSNRASPNGPLKDFPAAPGPAYWG